MSRPVGRMSNARTPFTKDNDAYCKGLNQYTHIGAFSNIFPEIFLRRTLERMSGTRAPYDTPVHTPFSAPAPPARPRYACPKEIGQLTLPVSNSLPTGVEQHGDTNGGLALRRRHFCSFWWTSTTKVAGLLSEREMLLHPSEVDLRWRGNQGEYPGFTIGRCRDVCEHFRHRLEQRSQTRTRSFCSLNNPHHWLR